MGKISQQYIEAIQDWAERTGQPANLIAGYMFMLSGGQWVRVLGEDPVDDTSVPPGARFTLDNTKRFLEGLPQRTGFTEVFLVTSFIRGVEDRLRVEYELHAQDEAERARRPQQVRDIAADPVKFAEFREGVRQQNQRLRDMGSAEKHNEIETPEDLLKFADVLEQLQAGDPSQKLFGDIPANENLEVWREVTAPILESRNLRDCEDEDFLSRH